MVRGGRRFEGGRGRGLVPRARLPETGVLPGDATAFGRSRQHHDVVDDGQKDAGEAIRQPRALTAQESNRICETQGARLKGDSKGLRPSSWGSINETRAWRRCNGQRNANGRIAS